MPSSISSSDSYSYEDRPIPELSWKKALLLGVILMVIGIGAWEYNARVIWGYGPEAYIDSPGLWAKERNRDDIYNDEAVVLIGSSRTVFDVDLDVFEEEAGVRPIQLAIVGTSPRPFLEDFANDENFKGLLIIGVAPEIFFRGSDGNHADILDYYKKESPSQRMGQRISMWFEPHLSFYDNYTFPLFSLLEHSGIQNREGIMSPGNPVWFIYETEEDRNSYLFWKVENLDYYQKYAQNTWQMFFDLDDKFGMPPFDLDAYLAELKGYVDKIRTRGGEVIFFRAPSGGKYRPRENKFQPRAENWDRLLAETNSLGVHFEDYPDMQGFRIPEWSHLHSDDAPVYTKALVHALDEKLKANGKPGILKKGGSK